MEERERGMCPTQKRMALDNRVKEQATFEGALIQRRYQLEHALAHGAACAVYAGMDTNLRRPIAVKAVPPAHAAVYRAALLATATIAHPAAVMVLDAVEQDGWYFIIQEYVDGTPLAAELERGLSSARAVKLGWQLALLLAYAHQRGVAHGDVTPTAVLIERDGTARLNNFCLPPDLAYFAQYAEAQARLAREMSDTGAPVAPAELAAELATPTGDLRAIGWLLWQALATTSPSGELRDFRADVPAEVRDLVERIVVLGHPRALTSMGDLLMALELAGTALRQWDVDDAQATPPAVRGYRDFVARSAPWSQAETQLNGLPWNVAPWQASSIPPNLPGYGAPRGGPMRAPVPTGPFDAPGLPGVPGTPERYLMPLDPGPIDTQSTVPIAPSLIPARPSRPSGPLRAPGVSGPLRAPSLSGPFRSPVPSVPMRAPGVSGPLRAPSLSGPMRAPGSSGPLRALTPSGRLRTPTGSLRAYGATPPIPSYRVRPALPWSDEPQLQEWATAPSSRPARGRSQPILVHAGNVGLLTLLLIGLVLFAICFVVGYFTPTLIPFH